MAMSIERCHTIDLPTIGDERGLLTFVEAGRHIPFPIARVFYIYEVGRDQRRGGHAHRRLEQVFLAIGGSYDLTIDDGRRRRSYRMSRPGTAFYVCPMIWGELENFSPGAVCLVLASDVYDEADYYRNYAEFLGDVGGR